MRNLFPRIRRTSGRTSRLAPRWPGRVRPCRFESLENRAMLSWTVMVYLDGDNNLETAAIADFLEMADVGSTDEVNIVVQLDRIGGYDTRYGNWTGTRRGLVEAGDTPNSAWGTSVGEADMGELDSLLEFVDWSVDHYQTDRYALVLWDHGDGLNGVCWDETSSDALDLADLQEMADSLPGLDLLGFDACLMGMVEIGYEVRNAFDVMVASEELEPGTGWNYRQFLDDLVHDVTLTPVELGDAIVDAYRLDHQYSGESVTLSAIDLDALGSAATGLVGALDDFAATMLAYATSDDWEWLASAIDGAQQFDAPYTEYRDLGGLMVAVVDASTTATVIQAAQDVLDALEATVFSEYHTRDLEASGLSLYCGSPDDASYVSFTWADYTDAIGFVADTHWKELLEAVADPSSADDPSATASPTLEKLVAASATLPYREFSLLAYVNDTTTDEVLTARVDWGDGSGLETLTVVRILPVATSSRVDIYSYGTTAAHTYTTLGSYLVTLTVEDSTGNVLEAASSVTVTPALLVPEADGSGALALEVQGSDDAEQITLRYLAATGQVLVSIPEADGYAELFAVDADTNITIWAGGGDDVVNLQASRFPLAATVWGGAGDDQIFGGRGNDTLYGDAGNDWIDGHYGDDAIAGGDGDDYLLGYHGNDTIAGGDGNDYVNGQQHDDHLEGNAGNDFLTGLHGVDDLLGGEGHDRLAGGLGDDLLRGGAGVDFLFGQEGNDILLGNSGADRLFGHEGSDLLVGGLDADYLMGHADDDVLVAGASPYDGEETDAAEAAGFAAADAALRHVLALWTTSDTLAARVAAIESSSTGLEKGVNCFDDSAPDEVRGSLGADWYLTYASDVLQKNLYDLVS